MVTMTVLVALSASLLVLAGIALVLQDAGRRHVPVRVEVERLRRPRLEPPREPRRRC